MTYSQSPLFITATALVKLPVFILIARISKYFSIPTHFSQLLLFLSQIFPSPNSRFKQVSTKILKTFITICIRFQHIYGCPIQFEPCCNGQHVSSNDSTVFTGCSICPWQIQPQLALITSVHFLCSDRTKYNCVPCTTFVTASSQVFLLSPHSSPSIHAYWFPVLMKGD